MNFCRRCGEALTQASGHLYRCAKNHAVYATSAPAVGVFFVSDDNQILLAERALEPHRGMLDAPGGFLDDGETFEEAAKRELREELSLTPEDYEPLAYLASGRDNYPYKEEQVPIVSVLFWSKLTTERPLRASDDVANVAWHPLHDINLTQLHAEDIRVGVRALQQLFPNKTGGSA